MAAQATVGPVPDWPLLRRSEPGGGVGPPRTVPRWSLPDLSVDAHHRPRRVRRRRRRPRHKLLLLDGAPPAGRAATCSTSAAATGPIARDRWPAGRRARRCGRSTSTSGPWRCAPANAAAAGVGNVRAVAPDEVPADVALRRHLVEPAGPDRQGALHDLLATWLGRLAAGRRAPASSCTSTSAPTRWPAGWPARAGPPSSGSARGWATACSRCARPPRRRRGREAARRRPSSSGSTASGGGGPTGRRGRCCLDSVQTPVQRRRRSSASAAAYRVEHL